MDSRARAEVIWVAKTTISQAICGGPEGCDRHITGRADLLLHEEIRDRDLCRYQ